MMMMISLRIIRCTLSQFVDAVLNERPISDVTN